MSLTIEWTRRIDHWRNALKENLYCRLGTLAMQGFTTSRQLTAEQAQAAAFKPVTTGEKWGAKWEYGWFTTEVTVPAAAEGQHFVIHIDVGGESVVFVNGRVAGARDWSHPFLALSRQAVPGERYRVLVEAYAGHGPTPCGGGPVTPPGRLTVPEPPPAQATVAESTFGVWNEDVYQLWLDVEALYELRGHIDPNLLRVSTIDQGLRDFTVLVDLEAPFEEMMAGVRAARQRLAPLLACVNGSTAPVMYAYGHAHIDIAWLWPLAETERKCARTFSNQLALMSEYPEFKFLQSQPHLFRMVKDKYPELYARIQKAVKAGQFIPEGGMWVEADTNVSGGESLIRQFIHGKRFFRDEFGVESEMLWLPDVFGYSGNMPQIMHGCGIKYFSTAKIFWNYNGGDPFPYNTFVWEGIDGSSVQAHFCNDYNSQTSPKFILARWNERVQKDGIAARLLPFGWGDGGGGATRDHIEYLRRERDLEGVPRVRIDSPVQFFRDLEAGGGASARYVGELYYQCHRGTYTTQSRTKRGNRKSELALREAELWGAAARALKGYVMPLATLDEAWKKVLLNQFHDIIPGSSIHRVYEEAEAAYADVIATARQVRDGASKALCAGDGTTVFNSLAWDRTELVELPQGQTAAAGADGKPLPAQSVNGRTLVEVAVPSCGWVSIRPCVASAPASSLLRATAQTLENEHLHLTINDKGEITGILDKDTGRELAAGPGNSFCMFKDVPGWFDAWDIDSMYALTPVPLPEPAAIEVAATGPLIATLRLTRQLSHSRLTQEISLRRGSRRVDFRTLIDWQESHKLLKVAFPVNVHANEAIHEIQFGHIRRPNHRSRPFDADRFEVANQKWTALAEENRGCAILNDCKYGINVLDNSMNLTLLRSPMAPDMTADKGRQAFTYAFYAWNGSFAESGVVREAYELNCPLHTAPGAAGQASLFRLDVPNVVIETVKPAEDGSSDIVVRLYESKHMATRCALGTTLPLKAVLQTNMLEQAGAPLPIAEGVIPLELRPFEIRTLRLKMG